MAPWECFGQIRLSYSSVGTGTEEQDDSVGEHRASFSAVAYHFNSSLLAGTGLLPIAIQQRDRRQRGLNGVVGGGQSGV